MAGHFVGQHLQGRRIVRRRPGFLRFLVARAEEKAPRFGAKVEFLAEVPDNGPSRIDPVKRPGHEQMAAIGDQRNRGGPGQLTDPSGPGSGRIDHDIGRYFFGFRLDGANLALADHNPAQGA